MENVARCVTKAALLAIQNPFCGQLWFAMSFEIPTQEITTDGNPFVCRISSENGSMVLNWLGLTASRADTNCCRFITNSMLGF